MPLEIDIITLFPDMFVGPFAESIIRRAVDAGLVSIRVRQLRDYATGKHKQTDDTPYGGGGGMVMKPEPIFAALEAVAGSVGAPPGLSIVLLTPQGRPLTQAIARELSRRERLVLICGRYEGVDERVRQHLATDEISIGDYVLSGGELAAMVLTDAVVRLLPGALGDVSATFEDSHESGLLEYPQYTRPAEFRGHRVPDELLSGNHAELVRWRRRQMLRRTAERRPDLLAKAQLTQEDRKYLAGLDPGERDPANE